MAAAPPNNRASDRKRKAVSYNADEYFESLKIEVDEQDAAKDAAVNSPEVESRDTSEEDGSFAQTRDGPALKKKAKPTPKVKKSKAVVPFPFMKLPAELRTDILELCLVEPGDLTLVSGTRDLRRIVRRRPIAIDDNAYYSGKIRYGGFGWRRRHAPANYSAVGANRRTSFSPNLCAVSKQMREEASTILYRQEIILEDTTALHIFLNTIGTFNRRLLADLTIKSWGRCSGKANNYGAFAAMVDCVNLQSLFLDCSIGSAYTPPEKVARQIYKDAHPFLEAFGSANEGHDAGVDVLEMGEFHFKVKGTDPTSAFSEEKYEQFTRTLRSYLRR